MKTLEELKVKYKEVVKRKDIEWLKKYTKWLNESQKELNNIYQEIEQRIEDGGGMYILSDKIYKSPAPFFMRYFTEQGFTVEYSLCSMDLEISGWDAE